VRLENRVEKLERQTHRDTMGKELLIKYPDGEETRLVRGKAPFETTIIKVAYEQSADDKRQFDTNIKAIFNGART